MSTSTAATQPFPATVGVLGGGRMGAGIAHAFLIAGAEEVVVVDVSEAAAQTAAARITKDLQASLSRGKIDGELASWADRLTATADVTAFTRCGLVVEAVPEDMALKVDSLRRAEAQLTPEAWLATNTSSLSITALAEHLQRPERFCGLHFFNPVPASKLVEVVLAERTGEELAALSPRWVEALGKTPVVVKDAPGFASSRLGVAIGLEAIRMVEEGVAAPADIDNAMVLGYKFPIGPLALTDIVGLDVRLGIAEYLESQLGERFAPPQLMREMVARGELGQKSGKGFYDYPEA
ncbi:3-hydroxyacyl-CoA dehydrogenase family protein [Nesterenkonia sp. LB17]|uniref:3-hydroxyacyl-CoA dehydrogenase family protein n=1 Tax=unclassified Nesterenkonia TaxID=2629769 RepID=UPI001F4CEEAD|nr:MULTISPECIES: 3-hydroxyacyl-CoA dehydrogenase family protein [unclassified Nesterenkonia]MCH8559960.1 3-hydroxyacyl-CoA dehydrogenase family protein [Nesterenkonia sp. DZ6]MCH8562140.1 3-hydroxyacyl-CoA dehydrogenase family protein [Nesterenkonia sp. YGD6]MCH8564330.1 3-hydroxyacyl-CoA dehydrogenase family protein [Nesterenkonia sp. LB17]MCH8569956.1 3-hydroxyacyl-CoA dehydrogenase family protein [Nesterenkonia sp. AY15]